MSDSDSDSGDAALVPSGAKLENQLRLEVGKRFQDRTIDTMTVNQVRVAAETALGLHTGFYSRHKKWKDKSKTVIRDELDKRTVPPSSPVAAPKSSPIGKPAPPKSASASKPLKRSSPTDETGSKKRRKTSALKNESEHGLKSSKSKAKPEPPKDQAEPPKATKFSGTSAQTTNGRPNKESETSLSDVPDDIDEPSKTKNDKASPTPEDGAGDSESELSEVLDEPPMRKRKQKSSEPVAEKKKTKGPKPTGDADMDPDAVEIKRLQGWLVKCGIRKLWGKELKPYETSNAKIKHLREMLSEAGMTGRYSIEKATQIKEARELAADIEAVQEGAERWGKSDKLEDDECPKRRLVRGAKNYDFLSSDGEETD